MVYSDLDNDRVSKAVDYVQCSWNVWWQLVQGMMLAYPMHPGTEGLAGR